MLRLHRSQDACLGADAPTYHPAESDRTSTKRFTSLAAALALKGRELHPLPSGGYLIVHVDRCRRAADLDVVAQIAAHLAHGVVA